MKYLHLIWAALSRRRGRTALTLLSIVMAFVLFGVLDAVRSTFAKFGQSSASYDRLITVSKMSFGTPLPLSLYAQIAKVPGVEKVDYGAGFVGTYQDAKNEVYAEAHTPAFFDLYPELALAAEERRVLADTRTGAIAGEALARQYNWKVGDTIPLKTAIERKDGSNVWTFNLVGIYHFTDPSMKAYETQLFFRTDYWLEAGVTNTVTFYALKIDNALEADRIIQAVDSISANSDHETKTQSENAFNAGMLAQLGDVGIIVTSVMGAAFFTLLLVTGHTAAVSVSERIPEIAILKTIGFARWKIVALVLSESVFMLLIGGVAGLGIASLCIKFAHSQIEKAFPMPILPVGLGVWLSGLAFAVAVGIIVGALPAWRGMRLRIADALSGH